MATKSNWQKAGIVLVTCGLVFICDAFSVPVSEGKKGADFYIATNGNDSNPGTIEKPFATLEKASEAIRAIKVKLAGPVMVWIRGGTYRLDETFVLGVEDSGTKQAPVIYRSYRGEKVIISGGRKISDWKKGAGNLWVTKVPGVKEGKWYFKQLFVNGKRGRRAQIPNKDYNMLVSIINPENRDDPVNKTGFIFKPGDFKRSWKNLEDVEILKLFRWSETRMFIADVDEEKNIVTFTGKTGGGYRLIDWNSGRYIIENVYEGLDSGGEWYLDRKSGILSYWPLPGEDMAKAEVVAPVVKELVRLQGDIDDGKVVRDIIFKGLTFSHSGWSIPKEGYRESQAEVCEPNESNSYDNPTGIARPTGAISAEGAVNCGIEDCEITLIGTHGVYLQRGCKNNRVTHNRIYDTGAGGVYIGEPVYRDDDVDVASGNIVSDNYIHDGGMVYTGAVAIWVGQSYSNILSHNELYNFNYSAISVGYNWGCDPKNHSRDNIIEYNRIHDLMLQLDDGGGIYILGVSPGTLIQNNLIYNVWGHGPIGRGIYYDQGGTCIIAKNNIIYNTKMGLSFGEGKNIVENNIFACKGQRQLFYKGGDAYGCFEEGEIFRKNIIYYDDPNAYLMTHYQLATIEETKEVFKESDYNLYWLVGGGEMRVDDLGDNKQPVKNYEQWKKLGFDAHSVVADPLFVDAANNNYNLKPNSPAFKLGFRAIDMSGVGPRPKGRFEK